MAKQVHSFSNSLLQIYGTLKAHLRKNLRHFESSLACVGISASPNPLHCGGVRCGHTHCLHARLVGQVVRRPLDSGRPGFGIMEFVCLFVCCLTSQQQASVSQGRICSDNFTCCHAEIEVADQTFYLTQSQYTDAGPTSPIADPITPGAWQGSHWSASF